MPEKNNGSNHENGNHRPIKTEVQPGVFDITFPHNPSTPAISDRVAGLVLGNARTDGEREMLEAAIDSANRHKSEGK